jgi:hypothetical protein
LVTKQLGTHHPKDASSYFSRDDAMFRDATNIFAPLNHQQIILQTASMAKCGDKDIFSSMHLRRSSIQKSQRLVEGAEKKTLQRSLFEPRLGVSIQYVLV